LPPLPPVAPLPPFTIPATLATQTFTSKPKRHART
jgi:hypothetical protein